MITFENTSHDPFYNQAFEEYIFNTCRDDDVFLAWQNEPAVIVGCYQNICREVHVPGLLARHIPVVRRMSGGGTVYHDLGNLNYTIISTQTELLDYDCYLTPVIHALNNMGIPAKKNRTCDIAIGDEKISGSAQKAAGGRVLHHGTLLFDSDLTILNQITATCKNDSFQSKGTVSAICPVTNIRRHLLRDMTVEEFRQRLLGKVLPPGSQTRTLSAEQISDVERLRDEKYRSWEWTWGRTPACRYEKEGLFSGMPIHITYAAKHGILSDAVVESPLLDGAKAAELLNGARLDPEEFFKISQVLAGSKAAELMDWLM